MKDEDGVQSAEFVAGNAQVEPDDDGVEDDTKFENEESGNLLLEGFFGADGVQVAHRVPAILAVFVVVGCLGNGFGVVGRVNIVFWESVVMLLNNRCSSSNVGGLVVHAILGLDIELGSKVH